MQKIHVQPLDIPIGDWDDLFRAVKVRLRLTVGELLAATSQTQANNTAGRVPAIVLGCVEALDQLHTALTLERGRRHQLELEVADEQTALAPLRKRSATLYRTSGSTDPHLKEDFP